MYLVICDIITIVTMHVVFLNMTLCNLVGIYQRCGMTSSLKMEAENASEGQ